MTLDPYTSHRTERWRWDLLTLAGAPAGALIGIQPGGKVEYSIFHTIRSGGDATYRTGSRAGIPDWNSVLIRPVYTATFVDGTTIEHPLGVFIPSASDEEWEDGSVSIDLELYDLLLPLDEDELSYAFAIPAGTNVIAQVKALITEVGVMGGAPKIVGTDSTEVTRSPLVWEAGVTRLRIINDLLSLINYFSLWVDTAGAYRLDPYTPPNARGVTRTFVNGADCVYVPDFSYGRDTFGVPNRVTLITRSDEDTPALTTTATNVDPLSPMSQPRRGRWVSRTFTDVEASSQAVLDQMGIRRLASLSQVSSTVEFKHAFLPLRLNDVVRFANTNASIDARAVIQSMSVPTSPGGVTSTKIREVTT